MNKHDKKWFKKIRGSYIPRTREGWLLYIPYTLLLVSVYWFAMSQFGYSIASLLLVIAGWVFVATGMTFFAAKRS